MLICWLLRWTKRVSGSPCVNGGFSRAFTLIELLVVLAILMVLMGLLLPALSVAEVRANKTKCLSNTRQIAIAAAQLFGDAGDALPYRSAATYWGEAAEQLLPYLKNVREVFDCPANPGALTNDVTKLPSYNFWTEYEMNGYLCACPGKESRRQSMITDFSKAAYAYDYPYDPAHPDRAHSGGINCSYLDGHASWLTDEVMGGVVWPDVDENTFYHGGHDLWKF